MKTSIEIEESVLLKMIKLCRDADVVPCKSFPDLADPTDRSVLVARMHLKRTRIGEEELYPHGKGFLLKRSRICLTASLAAAKPLNVYKFNVNTSQALLYKYITQQKQLEEAKESIEVTFPSIERHRKYVRMMFQWMRNDILAMGYSLKH